MDERQQKGLVIAATVTLAKRADGVWSVPAQSRPGKYTVVITKDGPNLRLP